MNTDECILMACDRQAEPRMPWCRPCWEEQREIRQGIHAQQSEECLARELDRSETETEFLVTLVGANRWHCTCGHLLQVHSWGGCNGLCGFDDTWDPCSCDAWVPRFDGPSTDGPLAAIREFAAKARHREQEGRA